MSRSGRVEVRAFGKEVGSVDLDPATGVWQLTYDEAWLECDLELSPLRSSKALGRVCEPELDERTHHHMPALIADHIPEHFGLSVARSALALNGIDLNEATTSDLLALIGSNTMGALTFHTPGQRQVSDIPISLENLRVSANEILSGGVRTRRLANELVRVGMSAAGVNAKGAVAFNPESRKFHSALGHTPEGFESWIVKLDGVTNNPNSVSGDSSVEYGYYLMAKAAGVQMSPSFLFKERGFKHFMTKRFDRLSDGSRLHMLSLQGLAGMDSSKIGMHSYEELLGVVEQITPGEMSTAFARIVFNIAAVNYDDSTRNFSFLMDSSGKWSLAPAYDLTFVSSYKHSELNAHKMSVGGKFTGVKVGDLVALAKEFKIKGYLEIIERVDEAVSIWPYFATQAGVDLGRSNFIRDEIVANGMGHLT